MKKTLFSALVMAFVLVSCNQKSKEETNTNSHMMSNDTTMRNDDSHMMNNSEMHGGQMYSCPMHPEVQGKLNDECSKCGMKLSEPVTEKTEESK